MLKDYSVYYKTADGTMHLLAEVTDNFQRVNELEFAPVCTSDIVICPKQTHGQDFFSIYEIRCYS